MGLRLRRTPVLVTRAILGAAVLLAVSAPAIAGVVTNRIVHASATPDISKVHFLSSERYVRESNATDVASQLITYNATTAVEFYVDGDTDHPISGGNFGTHDAQFHQWRLMTALASGKHTITAKVQIGGEWYEVPTFMTVYSLDMPSIEYVAPNVHHHVFRPDDSPLRLRVDDEFKQLESVTFSVYRYDTVKHEAGDHIGNFRVDRNECDKNKAGEYVICDVRAAKNWKDLSAEAGENTYIAKLTTNTFANNGIQVGMDGYWTQFTIDDKKPTVGDLQIDSSTIVKDSLSVSAVAADDNGVEGVTFYVTAPGDGGVCGGEGEKIVRQTVTDMVDGRHHATLDVSGINTHGQPLASYCVSAVASDNATNMSDANSTAFLIDHVAPVVTIRIISDTSPSASTPVTVTGAVDSKAILTLFKDGEKVDDFALTMSGPGQWSYRFDNGLEKGDHVLKIVASDTLGNSSSESTSPSSFTGLSVSAYVPPKETSTLSISITPPQLPQNVVVPATTVAQIIASHQADVPKNNDEAVLGAETSNDTGSPLNAVITPSTAGWMLLGVAWYWWLLLLAVIAGVISWLAAGIKARQTA